MYFEEAEDKAVLQASTDTRRVVEPQFGRCFGPRNRAGMAAGSLYPDSGLKPL